MQATQPPAQQTTQKPIPQTAPQAMQHALTVDVEDYFHVGAFVKNIDINDWDNWPSRVEASTQVLLDLFAEHQTKATFFVLGWVAQRYPELVRAIHAQGHEIASHGMSHQLVYGQSPAVFKEETLASKKLLEDIIGERVNGYRAASYSITPNSIWALETLIEAGFTYDSSIFPVKHDRYGMPGAPLQIHQARVNGGAAITEFPLTSASVLGQRVPAAGGGYFRLYPYWLTQLLLKKAAKELNQPFVFYLHPWEIDENQPRVEGASMLSRFRHYNNLDKCLPRMNTLLQQFSFTTMAEVIAQYASQNTLEACDYAQFRG
ncbi:XrtA system polysaccharide deacetylase [Dasania marina]|uniref:XrtA system polysaccharide deacetylase n=1 Tax=Dasania marina TaxID=471499 RepID=UPI0030DCCC9E|tara:strand:+ start:80485 stop:81438 length:954 start_codon:yes stop_codon:yes gene_type:complete